LLFQLIAHGCKAEEIRHIIQARAPAPDPAALLAQQRYSLRHAEPNILEITKVEEIRDIIKAGDARTGPETAT
jgi:hypothetical protein